YTKSSPPQTADNKTEVFIQLEVTFVGDVRVGDLGGFQLHAWVSLLWRDSRVNVELLHPAGPSHHARVPGAQRVASRRRLRGHRRGGPLGRAGRLRQGRRLLAFPPREPYSR
ncbi:hypothetical protein MTO96_040424, partial [Rhipicephalus appendiculatus]